MHLLPPGSPPDVARLIVTIVVDAVNGMAGDYYIGYVQPDAEQVRTDLRVGMTAPSEIEDTCNMRY